jgi:hypothetical protein
VAVRVLVVKDDGHGHLNILRKIATGSSSLLSNNHTLPLLAEFRLDDIVFGIFPRVGARMEEAFGYWPSNSVGDVMDMLLQALEVSQTLWHPRLLDLTLFFYKLQALAFIHASNIAHRVSSPFRIQDSLVPSLTGW